MPPPQPLAYSHVFFRIFLQMWPKINPSRSHKSAFWGISDTDIGLHRDNLDTNEIRSEEGKTDRNQKDVPIPEWCVPTSLVAVEFYKAPNGLKK